jgi:excisionase family DNA binding protein
MIIQFNFDEAQLVTVIKNAIKEAMEELTSQSEPSSERKILYSIKELASFLSCSLATAQKLKNAGRIPYRQVGRKVMFDSVEILMAMEPGKRKCR